MNFSTRIKVSRPLTSFHRLDLAPRMALPVRRTSNLRLEHLEHRELQELLGLDTIPRKWEAGAVVEGLDLDPDPDRSVACSTPRRPVGSPRVKVSRHQAQGHGIITSSLVPAARLVVLRVPPPDPTIGRHRITKPLLAPLMRLRESLLRLHSKPSRPLSRNPSARPQDSPPRAKRRRRRSTQSPLPPKSRPLQHRFQLTAQLNPANPSQLAPRALDLLKSSPPCLYLRLLSPSNRSRDRPANQRVRMTSRTLPPPLRLLYGTQHRPPRLLWPLRWLNSTRPPLASRPAATPWTTSPKRSTRCG